MENKPYNSKEREATISEMNTLLLRLNRHIKYLKEANKVLKKIDIDASKLENYYFSEWLEDYNQFSSENSYDVLLQDPIHNALQDVHTEKIKLLKKIVGNLE